MTFKYINNMEVNLFMVIKMIFNSLDFFIISALLHCAERFFIYICPHDKTIITKIFQWFEIVHIVHIILSLF